MAKKTVIQDRVKIRGIRKRWLVNSMGVVTLILLLAMGTLTLSLWAYYEGSMRDNLSSRASDTARSFSVYTRREYRTAATASRSRRSSMTRSESSQTPSMTCL